eukprot:364163-Chlamydomonas_euryale.AAC.3
MVYMAGRGDKLADAAVAHFAEIELIFIGVQCQAIWPIQGCRENAAKHRTERPNLASNDGDVSAVYLADDMVVSVGHKAHTIARATCNATRCAPGG